MGERPPVAGVVAAEDSGPSTRAGGRRGCPAARRSQSSHAQPCSCDERREEQRRVGDAAGDHDVGALRERVGDRARAEVRRREQRRRREARRTARRCRGARATARARRAARRAGVSTSSPSTVAILMPVTPIACAVSIAACAAAVGLMPPAFVMTFVRPSATNGSAAARYAGQVARVAARLVALAVLLQDRERQLGERLEAEVVDAFGEQRVDRGRRVAVEALPARDPSTVTACVRRGRGGRRSAHGRACFELRGDAEQQVLAAVRGHELRRRSAGRRRSTCSGSEIAGWPVMLRERRVRHERRGADEAEQRLVGRRRASPSGSGGSPSVGVSSRS